MKLRKFFPRNEKRHLQFIYYMSHFYQNYLYSVPLKVVVFIYSVKMLSFEKHVVKTARSSNINYVHYVLLFSVDFTKYNC